MGRWRKGLAGAVGLVLLALVWLILSPPALVRQAQERGFDILIQAIALPDPTRTPVPPVIVIDLGAVDETGQDWDRADTARLIDRLAEAGPAVLAFDIVFSGNCDPIPANRALATALARRPAVLGFLLSEEALPPPLPQPPLALAGTVAERLWQVPGAEAACADLGAAAQGTGSVALFSDPDGQVRRVPAAILIGGTAYPALAVEAVRVALRDPGPILGAGLEGTPGTWLRLGGRLIRLDPDAGIRIIPGDPALWPSRTMQANAVLDPQTDLSALAGAVLLIGSSLPERGGLRTTAASAVHPSVQIAADLARALLGGRVPHRQADAPRWEALAAALGGLIALGLILRLPTLPAIAGTAALALLWGGIVILLYRRHDLLLDPFGPLLVLGVVAFLTLVGQAALTGRAERVLRRKLGQLLPAPVVARLVENPALFRLSGESRVVTALFTDIEGFSVTARALGPRDLVRVLDAYFTLTCDIVLRHGGMVDKIVGDAVHAYFNAPLDQPGHVDAAIACATDILAATEAFRHRPDMADVQLGRTRIGIETGPVVLGDVGSGARIDYTAHGDAVNLAARLQEANKILGTAICIGPAAAAASTMRLRPVGDHDIRSFGTLSLFTVG
jgi:adenylate cyclase